MSRLNDLFGVDIWKNATTPKELTELFINRLISKRENTNAEVVTIPRAAGNFKLILLTSEYVKKQAKDWAKRVTSRINSIHCKEISKLLDVKAGRRTSLKDFGI